MFNGRRIPLEQARDSPESKKWLNTLVLWWCWFDMCRAYVFVPFQSTPVLIQLQIQNIAMLQRDRNLSIIPSTLQPPIHLSIQSWYLPISCRASWCDCEFNRTGKWKMETTWMIINGGLKLIWSVAFKEKNSDMIQLIPYESSILGDMWKMYYCLKILILKQQINTCSTTSWKLCA